MAFADSKCQTLTTFLFQLLSFTAALRFHYLLKYHNLLDFQILNMRFQELE